MADSSIVKPPLSQGVAYGIVLGFGIVFALTMNLITWISRRFLDESADANMQLTARNSVKTGLVAAAVVSSWCYAATTLNSVRLTYVYGFAGLWWFVAGATVQILLYAIMAIELKRRAPRANTILEALRIRFGTRTHIVFFVYGVAIQILITATLLLGGSAALNVTTGASTVAMNYLIPLGVVVYTYLGGHKSTFLSDYIHPWNSGQTVRSLANRCCQNNRIRGQGRVISDHAIGRGSDLGVVILVSGFGSVFVDTSCGQKAIAGAPTAVVNRYFFGAFAWFSIPLGLCATMSYVAIALSETEYWPVSGGVTSYQINNALILPLAAEAVMGKGGAAAVILMVFMAVTSSFSAEIIAHASIVTFDIYQPYINPTADDKRLRLISHASLSFFAIFSASFATALNASGISMGWILEFICVVLGAAVISITLAVNSAHVSSMYMYTAAPIGTVCGLVAWLATTKGMYGEVNVTTTFENWPMFAGSMRPFAAKFDCEHLFLTQAVQPRPGDKTFSPGDESDLGGDWDDVARGKDRILLSWYRRIIMSFLDGG
ncbi:hypothetical protein BDV96DRAFT_597921 [Lophiotrema nucula]|uniref:Sodium:solute symporter family-domain-containing protein n=1 Tax=Lophiotrema nucula TaxID=690887 RepID=A0A6A5ZCP2_9PLEO|nr:hypothetical protein BDV96DRAFT_597921 [Lophiotrema nucula]